MKREVPPILSSNREISVLMNATRDWAVIWAAIAYPRPVAENIVTERLVITRIGIRVADRMMAPSGTDTPETLPCCRVHRTSKNSAATDAAMPAKTAILAKSRARSDADASP